MARFISSLCVAPASLPYSVSVGPLDETRSNDLYEWLKSDAVPGRFAIKWRHDPANGIPRPGQEYWAIGFTEAEPAAECALRFG